MTINYTVKPREEGCFLIGDIITPSINTGPTIAVHGKGPFTVLDIIPDPQYKQRLVINGITPNAYPIAGLFKLLNT